MRSCVEVTRATRQVSQTVAPQLTDLLRPVLQLGGPHSGPRLVNQLEADHGNACQCVMHKRRNKEFRVATAQLVKKQWLLKRPGRKRRVAKSSDSHEACTQVAEACGRGGP